MAIFATFNPCSADQGSRRAAQHAHVKPDATASESFGHLSMI
ncbi:hypothetical protein [Segatella baroniae]|nr:hypothetical protein [Segatella baroniae]